MIVSNLSLTSQAISLALNRRMFGSWSLVVDRFVASDPRGHQSTIGKNLGSAVLWLLLMASLAPAQPPAERLQEDLANTPVDVLVARAEQRGTAKQGALVFYTSAAGCVQCHSSGQANSPLGPDLAELGRDVTAVHVIESILHPSKKIREGFETVTIDTHDGKVVTGLIVRDEEDRIILRDATNLEQEITIKKDDIDSQQISKTSMMPHGLVDSLRGRGDFDHLVRYILEVAHGGAERAAELRPRPENVAVIDDSRNLDHAGIIRSLGRDDFEAGQRIFLGHCKNCHGVDGNHPSLPTARAFGTQPLKFGADLYSMLLTLTRGNGLMAPMSHLSPKERYQVAHFIREQFVKPSNPTYHRVDDEYLDSLPKGTGQGSFSVAGERDYGPVLASQLGNDVNNSLTFRLPKEVTVNYDLHRMRLGGVWQGGFLDLSQTHHNRLRGEGMPEVDGEAIPGLDGWAWAFDDSFELPPDVKQPRAPVRSDYLQYFGHYLYDDRAVLSYGIHGRRVLETIDAAADRGLLTIEHTLRIEPGDVELKLSVGRFGEPGCPAGVIARGEIEPEQRSGSVHRQLAMIDDGASHVVAGIVGDVKSLTWSIDDDNHMVLLIPADDNATVIRIIRGHGVGEDHLYSFSDYVTETETSQSLLDPGEMLAGGRTRWPQRIQVQGTLGEPINGYALDSIPVPFENPWNAWVRTSALDFFEDGRAVVTTYGGDVYIVDGLDDQLDHVTWQRIVSGLFEPFGVRVVNETIYVTCRDGIKRLYDYDGNGETDFVEVFWNDDDVSCSFHAFNFDLQTDAEGYFHIAKAGQYSDHRRPGSIMRIPPEGGSAELVAWGLRTPNGMGQLEDGRFTVSDNQGPWMPASKVSVINPNAFLGNMPINNDQDRWLRARHGGELPDTFQEPFIWMPQELDSSSGGQLFANDARWGPLAGRLIHSSYGKGWLNYMSLQEVRGQLQGSIVRLPHQWDAGVMRLRTNPLDGQVYGTGLSGWQGPPDGKDGCLQRLRYVGGPVRLVDDVQVTDSGIRLTFNFMLDPSTSLEADRWKGEMWNYLWSRKYGSDQFSVINPAEQGRDKLAIRAIQLSGDHRTVHLSIPDLQVCDQALFRLDLRDANDQPFREALYLTIHGIPGRP